MKVKGLKAPSFDINETHLCFQESNAMFNRAIPVAMTTHLCALYIRWRGWGREVVFARSAALV